MDLQQQGCPSEDCFYFEGVAWFLAENPKAAAESLSLIASLRGNSAFSQVFALLFYQALLDARPTQQDSQ